MSTDPAARVLTRTWLVLVAATLVLLALVENDAPPRVATVAVLLIAAFKVRLVFLHFMELAGGVQPWRRVAEVWVGAVTVLLVGVYLATPG